MAMSKAFHQLSFRISLNSLRSLSLQDRVLNNLIELGSILSIEVLDLQLIDA